MKWYTQRQMRERCGTSYRQLDHWTVLGHLRSPEAGQGSGSVRYWNETEAEIATLMVRLTKSAGMNLDVASYLARRAVEDDVETLALGHGMTLHVPRPEDGYAAHRDVGVDS